jgi:hypothetical protein
MGFLKADDHWCERGNTLLETGEGNMVAWLDLEGNHRLQVSWCPDNYPALNVSVIELTDEQLAAHINDKCGGWLIRKCNIDGVNDENGSVAGKDEDGDDDDVCPQCGEPNCYFMKDTDGTNTEEVYGCPDCDS